MTEINITDWFMKNNLLGSPDVLEFMKAANKLQVKFKIKQMIIKVVE